MSICKKKDIIDIDARDMVKAMKRKLILEQHKYEVWQGTGEDKRWKTHLPPDNKIIAKQTKEALEDAIIAYYCENSPEQKCTLKTLYREWLDDKSSTATSTNYIRRIDNDWNKYYLNSPIINIPLKKLDYLQLNKWAHSIIKDCQLTNRQFYNMQVIIKQMFSYAVEKKILAENPYARIKINSKVFTVPVKKESYTQVFLIDEQPMVEAEAHKDFASTNSVNSLAILLAFQTGLRIGEIVALKYSDIKGNYVYVQRTEVRKQKQNEDGSWQKAKYVIVEHAKSHAGLRKIYLTSKARDILDLIKKTNLKNGYSDNGFIFVDSNGRVRTRALDYRLRKCCSKAGISEKSMHKIRKTYISTLIDNNVSIDTITETVGHKDKRTTYNSYCYSRYSDEQTENILEKALCS